MDISFCDTSAHTTNPLGSNLGVIARLDRAIQYAAALRFKPRRLWNTGSPAPVRNCAQGG
jgi:hypothetical protein